MTARRGLMRSSALITPLITLLITLLIATSCGVAPVRWSDSAAPPPQWTYVGVHGRPLAYRGGVCAVRAPHPHKYPPAPREMFKETAGGWYDTRPVFPFIGRHPHHGRTCHLEGWHLHHERPEPALVFDDQKSAWRAAPVTTP